MGEERLSIEEALRIYTLGGAYLGVRERELGMIKEGMKADLTIIRENIFKISPDKLRELKPWKVIVNGKIILNHS